MDTQDKIIIDRIRVEIGPNEFNPMGFLDGTKGRDVLSLRVEVFGAGKHAKLTDYFPVNDFMSKFDYIWKYLGEHIKENMPDILTTDNQKQSTNNGYQPTHGPDNPTPPKGGTGQNL